MSFTDEDVFRARILTDDKQLRRIARKMTLLANAKGAHGSDPSEQELDNLHAALLTELSSYFVTGQHKAASHAAASDVDYYHAQSTAIQDNMASIKSNIRDLQAQLLEAQQLRANKLEYDALTLKINALPTRSTLVENITRLDKDLLDLDTQAQQWKMVWKNRQTAFDSIVDALQETFSSLREEKAELERKNALDEDDEQMEDAQNDNEDQHEERQPVPKLNPQADEFVPLDKSVSLEGDKEDVEMGSDRHSRSGEDRRRAAEELEEGEEET